LVKKKKSATKKVETKKADTTVNGDKTGVSRSDDLAFVEREIGAKTAERNAIAQKYQDYHQKISDCVKAIMVEAGIWEECNQLELGRNKVRQDAQASIDRCNTEIEDLRKVQNFLLGRAGALPDRPSKDERAPEDAGEEEEEELTLNEEPGEAAPAGQDDSSTKREVPAPPTF